MNQLKLSLGNPRDVRSSGPNLTPRHPKGKLSPSTQRVFDLMSDGYWHTPDEIRKAAGKAGYPASEGLRRMRSLRKFYTVERTRVRNQFWIYRLR